MSFLIIADWICTKISVLLMALIVPLSKVMKKAKNSSKKYVFVYANDLLGDTMIKFPFFFSLRNEFPRERYHIVAVLSPVMAEMLGKIALFDEIIEETPLHWRHPMFWILRREGMANSLKWAFRHTADVFIACHRARSLGCDFAMDLLNPSVSVGYRADVQTPMLPATARYQAKNYDGKYTHLLVAEDGRHQMKDMNMLLSFAIGREIKSEAPPPEVLVRMLDFSLLDLGVDAEYIVFVPGARVEYRRWPIDRFMELAKRFYGTIVIVGGREESLLAKKIATSCRRAIDLCGKTSLAQLGGVLAKAKYVVTNETGTASYSAILGVKTICILGGGDFGAFFPNPYCPNAISVFHSDDCFNCGWKCKKTDLEGTVVAPCISSITVDDVCDAIKKHD